MRWVLILLALAGCDTAQPPPPAVTGSVPPPRPTRFDGSYAGIATRSFGTDSICGGASVPLRMVVAQGRATGSLPRQGQSTGIVSGDGSLTLRSGQDAAERTAGRISDRFEFSARYQTNLCAWDIRLNRV
jgi:hypothetical protein